MPPLSITEFAPAKINLTLHVTGQRADGYHHLDSLVVFCAIGDHVRVERADRTTLEVTGPAAGLVPHGGDNLVLRAAQIVVPHHSVAIRLEKNLPVASGLGGGSSDAAATIRAIRRLLPDDPATADHAVATGLAALLSLGADLPVCLRATAARMRGIGERVEGAPPLPKAHVLLVNPGVAVPTPLVFRALTNKTNAPMPDKLPMLPDARALADWLRSQRNDLELPARQFAPEIDAVLAAISASDRVLIARMSGSGATCFGLFVTAADAAAAAARIGRARPGWWVACGPILQTPPSPVS